DSRDRGAGGRGRQTRALRHQFRQGQDDVAGSDREDRFRRHAQACRAAAGQARAGNVERSRPYQAHHVVAPRAGIRSQDQLRRHRSDRRGGARPLPLGDPARAVLLGAPALRGRARSALARNLGGQAQNRDRSDQGNRRRAGKGPPPRSQARGGRGRGRRRGGGGRGGVSARPFSRANLKARRRRRAFAMPAGRAKGGANLLLNKEKYGEVMSRRSHNYARFAKKMKPHSGRGQQCGGTCGGSTKGGWACLAILGGAGVGGLAAGFNARANLPPQPVSSTIVATVAATVADMAPSDSVNLRFPADWVDAEVEPVSRMLAFASADSGIALFSRRRTYAATDADAPVMVEATPKPAAPAAPTKVALASATTKPAKPRSNLVLNDSQLAGIKKRLNLTPEQERYWPAVE